MGDAPQPVPITLGAFLQAKIDELGLTYDQFAKMAGMTRSHIYFIVNNQRTKPRSDTIDRIAAALGITPADIFIALGKGAPLDDPERASLLALIRDLPPEHIHTVEQMVRPLTSQASRSRSAAKRRGEGGANRKRGRAVELAGHSLDISGNRPSTTLIVCSPPQKRRNQSHRRPNFASAQR